MDEFIIQDGVRAPWFSGSAMDSEKGRGIDTALGQVS